MSLNQLERLLHVFLMLGVLCCLSCERFLGGGDVSVATSYPGLFGTSSDHPLDIRVVWIEGLRVQPGGSIPGKSISGESTRKTFRFPRQSSMPRSVSVRWMVVGESDEQLQTVEIPECKGSTKAILFHLSSDAVWTCKLVDEATWKE
jgi:hypothetical protein